MRPGFSQIGGRVLRTYAADTAVVGSGCAGLAAADRLAHYGGGQTVLVTEDINAGTSRNAGSDKQTYYKLSLASDHRDSVRDMARTLFGGGCVDGDHALIEAAQSARCFFRLCELGVPFPQTRYGEYVGYKTDHDPAQRGTSAGPLTSRLMTLALESAVKRRGIPVFDRSLVVEILTDDAGVTGLLCLDRDAVGKPEDCFFLIRCANVILATGGPAGIYRDVCYPVGHWGAGALAYRAGAAGKNMTEWQYGLASVRPRWNVSGTFMQALPRFVSTDADGGDVREFLPETLGKAAVLNLTFLKGYQWPFDARKARDGSSAIDLRVHEEVRQRGRRVFLDYRANPLGDAFDFALLEGEADAYLRSGGALLPTPIERLKRLNPPAADFYRERGVDLEKEPLEIALCAQHNNGGIDVDRWWQTRVPGLFAIGEAAGTHGVYRPGGSALNAGQVGAERAALFISRRGRRLESLSGQWSAASEARCAEALSLAERPEKPAFDLREAMEAARRDMSACGGPVRDPAEMKRLLSRCLERLARLRDAASAGPEALVERYRFRDLLEAQILHLSAMLDYVRHGGGDRGSAVYAGVGVGADLTGQVQLVRCENGRPEIEWRNVRPLPEEDLFFENEWRGYRENGNID